MEGLPSLLVNGVTLVGPTLSDAVASAPSLSRSYKPKAELVWASYLPPCK